MKKIIATLLMSMMLSTTWAKDTVKLMIPVPPGGTWDSVSRALAKHMGPHIKSSIVVENRAGAMSQIGIRDFATSNDGSNTSLLVAIPAVFTVDFDGSDQVVPIAYLGSVPESLVARSDSRFNQIRDVVTTQSQTTLACVGDGGLPRFLTIAAKNTNLMCVPYKGGPQGMTDVMGGHIDIATTGLAAAKSIRESGRIKILGHTGHKRSHLAPDVPTLVEQGINLPSSLKFWVFAHKDTPPKKIAELQQIIQATINGAEFKAAVYDLGLEIEPHRGSAADYFYHSKTLLLNMYKK